MTIIAKEKSDKLNLSIDDEMTIYTALEHKKSLLEYLKIGKDIEINLSSVSEIDSAGVQLLMFFKHEAEQHNFKLVLVEHSQAVTEVFELLNLGSHFGDPMVLSAEWG